MKTTTDPMILVDMNQVMIANLMVSLTQSDELKEGLVRHMVLNSLRRYRSEFRKEYGELVLCTTPSITGVENSSLTTRELGRKTERSPSTTGTTSLMY